MTESTPIEKRNIAYTIGSSIVLAVALTCLVAGIIGIAKGQSLGFSIVLAIGSLVVGFFALLCVVNGRKGVIKELLDGLSTLG